MAKILELFLLLSREDLSSFFPRRIASNRAGIVVSFPSNLPIFRYSAGSGKYGGHRTHYGLFSNSRLVIVVVVVSR